MAARFDTNTDVLSSTTPLTDNFSITFWTKLDVDTNAVATQFILGNNAFTNFSTLHTTSDGTSMIFTTDSFTDVPMQSLVVGAWYRMAVTKSGAAVKAYMGVLGGALTQYSNTSVTGTINFLIFGASDTVGSEPLNGCLAAVKVWNSVTLTQAEVEVEHSQYVPIKAGVTRLYPFIGAGTADFSGNGNSLTAGSTATTTEDGPPIPWSVLPTPQQLTAPRRAANF